VRNTFPKIDFYYQKAADKIEPLRDAIFSLDMTKHVLLVMGGLLYLGYSFLLFKISKEFHTGKYFFAGIPVFQELLVLKMAECSRWWLTGYFVPVVQFIIPIYLWRRIAWFMGKEKHFANLVIIPFVNLFVLWYFTRPLPFEKRMKRKRMETPSAEPLGEDIKKGIQYDI
ncbi:MAG: hypothetical protein KC713_04615, partial [Candidatus Omnitrophica bacterium]|nr:hypothetical protein [Candidatus Omnitrophota bacterium]